MPKYYCDYCDVFLTHDSVSVRKAHNAGRNHLNNVKDYYSSLGHDKCQKWIDDLTRAIEKGLPPPPPPPGVLGPNAPSMAPVHMPIMFAPPPMPMAPPGLPMPPPGLPMPPPGMPLPPPGLVLPPGLAPPPQIPMPYANGAAPMDGVMPTPSSQPAPIQSSSVALKPGQILLYGDNDTSPEEKRATQPRYRVKNEMARPEIDADGPVGARSRASAAQFM